MIKVCYDLCFINIEVTFLGNAKTLLQVSNENFYKPLTRPVVSETATKVITIINALFTNGHIDQMTHKWLSLGQNPPRIPEFYTLTKIHKTIPVGRPIVSGSGGPTERISSFVDSRLQPIAQKQESYIKDTTRFINFIENTPLPEAAILATLDCTLTSPRKRESKSFVASTKNTISLFYPSLLNFWETQCG